MKIINTVIFGATGSIGNSFFSIVRRNKKKFKIEGITCNKNVKKLINLADENKEKNVGYNKDTLIKKDIIKNKNISQIDTLDEFDKIITKKTDIIIFAISGIRAINLFIKILMSGKTVGIANKECIISLGDNVIRIAEKYKTKIVPLDSEHNSIYHLLKNDKNIFSSITITASGGPFINYKYRDFKSITPKQALKHPVWKMGKKITIDSSTLMNKAMEIIEAKYLFNLKTSSIKAVIHPQSIIHAMINFENGISKALLYKPDMIVPISTLFFGLDKNYVKKNNELNLSSINDLQFSEIDQKKFPSVPLAYEVMKEGGLAPHVFNYLNELLVDQFLNRNIQFTDIVKLNYKNIERVFKKNAQTHFRPCIF